LIVDDSNLTYNTSTDILTLGGATDASSTTTGTLIVTGGVGVAKKLYVGTDLNVTANTTLSGTTESTSTTTGSLKTAGGLGVAKNLYVGGLVDVANTTQSTSVTTGALIVDGGAGIAKTLTLGYGMVLNPNGTITFGDGTVQSSRAFKFFTNADVALGLTTDDLLPGDWYFDDTTESIYVMVNYGDYNQLQDLTVRPAI
jgi:hypothetical protein